MSVSYQEFTQFFDQALEDRGIRRFQKAHDQLKRDVENLRQAVRQLIPFAQPCRPSDIAREEYEMNSDSSFGGMGMFGSYEHTDHCVRCNPDLLQPMIRSEQENNEARLRIEHQAAELNAKFKQQEREYKAAQKEWEAQLRRESTEWRERLNAQRDPTKAGTPIDVDEVK